MSGRRKKGRGFSIGTMVMLALTAVVLVGMISVLTRLAGDATVTLDTTKMLEALKLDGIFEVSFHDIPLLGATETPTVPSAPTPAPTSDASTPLPTQAPSPTPSAGGSIRLTIGGSVCVETNVRQSGYYKDSKKYDLDEVLSLLKAELTGDITLVTFENLVYAEGKVSELVAPPAALHMLKANGVRAINLGFAKALDKGVNALAQTVQSAQDEGLTVLGAYAQESGERSSIRIEEHGGVKVALLHYTDQLSSAAKKKLSGKEWMLSVSENAVSDIVKARQMGADAVIVSLSWGKSGASSVTKAQKTLAQQLADAGADVIVGAGSHVIQPAVWLKGKDGKETLCCYSLGSLLGDSRSDAGVAGMLLQLTINVDAAGRVTMPVTAYTPTYIWRYKQDGAYHYRVVASDGPAPDGMDSAQQTSRARALKNVEKYLGEESPLSLRIRLSGN